MNEDGSVDVMSTVTYGVDWWTSDDQPAENVASFRLKLALRLDATNMEPKRLAIIPCDLRFASTNASYKFRLQLLEELQAIGTKRSS